MKSSLHHPESAVTNHHTIMPPYIRGLNVNLMKYLLMINIDSWLSQRHKYIWVCQEGQSA